MICAKCHHANENHGGICSGSIECFCEEFVEPVLENFAQQVEKYKAEHKGVFKRVKYILTKLPPTRNAGEKTFAKIYREIWYGFKIRKDGTKLTTEEWKRMKHDDTINRQKRLVKAEYPDLATYDPKVLFEQTALYQAIIEQAAGVE